MDYCCDEWKLKFTDSSDMKLKFGVDVRPVITQGTTDYNELDNKPQVNGVTLIGNKTNEQLNINAISNTEIEEILKLFV